MLRTPRDMDLQESPIEGSCCRGGHGLHPSSTRTRPRTLPPSISARCLDSTADYQRIQGSMLASSDFILRHDHYCICLPLDNLKLSSFNICKSCFSVVKCNGSKASLRSRDQQCIAYQINAMAPSLRSSILVGATNLGFDLICIDVDYC